MAIGKGEAKATKQCDDAVYLARRSHQWTWVVWVLAASDRRRCNKYRGTDTAFSKRKRQEAFCSLDLFATQPSALHTQEQQAEGETGEAGSSGQQGNPNEGQQRELQLDMQTTEGQMEECARVASQCTSAA